MTVLTALPVQNTRGVSAIYDIPIKCVEEQIASIFDDIKVDAIKIGMLNAVEVIELVALKLKSLLSQKIILDPVMVAKSGHKLLQKEAIRTLKKYLLPLATIVTPNIPEAAELLGYEISNEASMEKAAREILELGPEAVLLKGGHLYSDLSKDVLVWKDKMQWFESERIKTKNTHGTGCTLSAAVAALMAQDFSVMESVSMAKRYITNAIKEGSKEKVGYGNGPVHHFYHLWPSHHHLMDSSNKSFLEAAYKEEE